MIILRVAVPLVLSLAVSAGYLTYLFIAPAPVAQQVLPTTVSLASTVRQVLATDEDTLTNIDQRPRAEEIASAFRKAAEANALKQAPEEQKLAEVQEAAVGADEPAIAGPIPLPKRRPAPRP
jgi:hypothetical protein